MNHHNFVNYQSANYFPFKFLQTAADRVYNYDQTIDQTHYYYNTSMNDYANNKPSTSYDYFNIYNTRQPQPHHSTFISNGHSEPVNNSTLATQHPTKRSKYCQDLACQICGDVASGLHYGAFTCQACKLFFVRALRNDKKNKMEPCETSSCQISKKNRAVCPECRFKKCISVGMSKTRSRHGRIPYRVSPSSQTPIEFKQEPSALSDQQFSYSSIDTTQNFNPQFNSSIASSSSPSSSSVNMSTLHTDLYSSISSPHQFVSSPCSTTLPSFADFSN